MGGGGRHTDPLGIEREFQLGLPKNAKLWTRIERSKHAKGNNPRFKSQKWDSRPVL